ncbi:uncharacterized protein LOC134272913 [Saccostrea cucullata]|uniref:uncharacterized protein LOC134272913 n=1 Tax=Saccostrea cuccullata TaxID=36930 RepID=UPI002ED5DCD3
MCAVKDSYRHFMIHRLQQQKIKINRHIASIEIYEHRYEKSIKTAVKFLVFLKKALVPKIKDTLNLTQHALLYLTEEIITDDVVEFLSEIQVAQKQVRDEDLLKQISTPVLVRTVELKIPGYARHISCLTSDLFWVSQWHNNTSNVILKNTEGDTLHQLTKRLPYSRRNIINGAHTVNNQGELIYVDTEKNIFKFSTDNKTRSLLIKGTDFGEWGARCVYYSAIKGDLLVGLLNHEKAGKVNRYRITNQHIQTIQQNNTGQGLYSYPSYPTENCNEDVIVSDSLRGVVVTDRKGKHGFSYTRHPSGSRLSPNGICTDALSHLLVCDGNTHTVQIIDKDGYFLTQILTKEQGIYRPHSLCYDNKTNLLWVGSWNENTLCIYKYIKRKSCETGAGEGYL